MKSAAFFQDKDWRQQLGIDPDLRGTGNEDKNVTNYVGKKATWFLRSSISLKRDSTAPSHS